MTLFQEVLSNSMDFGLLKTRLARVATAWGNHEGYFIGGVSEDDVIQAVPHYKGEGIFILIEERSEDGLRCEFVPLLIPNRVFQDENYLYEIERDYLESVSDVMSA